VSGAVAVIGAALDLGQSRRGVDMGPSAIRYAGLDERLGSIGFDVRDRGNIETAHPEGVVVSNERARYLSEILDACARVASLVSAAVDEGAVPLVLGGDHSVAIGTLAGLARSHGGPGGAIWLDAHGDLNTPESSPSGNLWGMPLRMAIDEGSVRTDDIALVGARDLDPPEREYIEEHGIDDDLARALDGADAVYVALDADVLEPGAVPVFMPAPGGLELDDVERLLLEVASGARLAGMGFTGLAPGADPAILARFADAAGL